MAEAGERSRQVNRLLQALAAEYARGWPMYNDPTEPGPTELLIKASDEMGNLINRLWQQRRDILQECADATGRPMHLPVRYLNGGGLLCEVPETTAAIIG